MSHQIKLSADTSQIKKELMALTKLTKNLGGKQKAQLFDKETMKFMDGLKNKTLDAIDKKYSKIVSNNRELLRILKEQNLTEKQREKIQERLIARTNKAASMAQSGNELRKTSLSRLGQFRQGFGKTMANIPGVSSIGNAIGAGSFGIGGLAAGGLLAAGAFGISRAYQGYNTFNQNADSRIALMGRGFSSADVNRTSRMANKYGASAEDIRQIQLQSTDAFGKSRSSFDSAIGTQAISRSMGISAGQLLGVGGSIRGQVGSANAASTQSKVEARLIATELDGVVGPWLETMTNILSDINENGIGLDDAAIAVLGTFANSKSGMSPETVAKMFGGIDKSIKGATGERAAFFMSAFAGKGMGGGSLGGAQLAMQQGLFGGDASKLRSRGNMDPAMIKQLVNERVLYEGNNGVRGFQGRAKGITDMFNKTSSGMGTYGKMFQAQSILGNDNAVEAMEMMGLLQQAANGKLDSAGKKRLGDLGKSPQQRLEEINKDQAGALRVSQAGAADSSDLLGKSVADLAVIGNNLLASIDRNIASITGLIVDAKAYWGSGNEKVAGVPEALRKRVSEDYTAATKAGKKYKLPGNF